jgi:hypothetical protein
LARAQSRRSALRALAPFSTITQLLRRRASERIVLSNPRSLRSLSPQAVADIIRTTLGPRSMLKMLLDANGGARSFVCVCVTGARVVRGA